MLLNSLTCPQRLKGAIDSRIAEEQARQKSTGASSTTIARSGSTSKKPAGRTDSPSSRPRKPRPKDNEVNTARGPDPSEFENAFVIDDEPEEPSRVGTPAIGEEKTATMAEGNVPAESGALGESKEIAAEKPVEASPKAPQLSPEVRTKLRKLEKMETKYQGRALRGTGRLDLTNNFQTSYDHTESHMLEPFR